MFQARDHESVTLTGFQRRRFDEFSLVWFDEIFSFFFGFRFDVTFPFSLAIWLPPDYFNYFVLIVRFCRNVFVSRGSISILFVSFAFVLLSNQGILFIRVRLLIWFNLEWNENEILKKSKSESPMLRNWFAETHQLRPSASWKLLRLVYAKIQILAVCHKKYKAFYFKNEWEIWIKLKYHFFDNWNVQ